MKVFKKLEEICDCQACELYHITREDRPMGGLSRSVRNLTIWMVVLSAVVIGSIIINEKKKNYTELHRRVRTIEIMLGIK